MDAGYILDAVRALEKAMGFDECGPATYGRMVSLMMAAKERREALDLAIQQGHLTKRAWMNDIIRGQTTSQ